MQKQRLIGLAEVCGQDSCHVQFEESSIHPGQKFVNALLLERVFIYHTDSLLSAIYHTDRPYSSKNKDLG